MGIPVKVTVESASTSETEETEDLEDVIHHPVLTKSQDKVNVAEYQQFQVRSMFCALNFMNTSDINSAVFERWNIRWVRSWLDDCIVVNGSLCKWRPVTGSVP